MTDLEHIAEIFTGLEGIPDGYGAAAGYRCFRRAIPEPTWAPMARGAAKAVSKRRDRMAALVAGREARKAALRARVGR